jgi:hypothetical protein
VRMVTPGPGGRDPSGLMSTGNFVAV